LIFYKRLLSNTRIDLKGCRRNAPYHGHKKLNLNAVL